MIGEKTLDIWYKIRLQLEYKINIINSTRCRGKLDKITHDEITQYNEFLEGEDSGQVRGYEKAIQQARNYVRRKAHGIMLNSGCYHVRRLRTSDNQWALIEGQQG